MSLFKTCKYEWLKLGIQGRVNGRNDFGTVLQHNRQVIVMVSSSHKLYKCVNWNLNESLWSNVWLAILKGEMSYDKVVGKKIRSVGKPFLGKAVKTKSVTG